MGDGLGTAAMTGRPDDRSRSDPVRVERPTPNDGAYDWND
jgi:hypothetical protein